MLFTTKAKDRTIELLMTSVPGFPPKGHGVHTFFRHQYTAKDCDCHFCLCYKRNKCTLLKCGCIEERIGALSIEFVEFMKYAFETIRNQDFQKRLTQYFKYEREMKSMMYRGNAHKEMFERAIERNPIGDNAMLSAIYLLTADKLLWSKVKYAVCNNSINFSAVRLGDVSTDSYAIYMTAKDLYSGSKHITVSDLWKQRQTK